MLHSITRLKGKLCRSRPHFFHPLLFNSPKRLFKSQDERQSWRERGVPIFERFIVRRKIKVVSGKFRILIECPSLLTNSQKGEPRRNHNSFLRSTDNNIHSPSV